MLPLMEIEAKERQIETGKHGAEGGRGNKKEETLRARIPEGFKAPEPAPRPREVAAKLVGVSERYVQDMKTIAKAAPEKIEQSEKQRPDFHLRRSGLFVRHPI